MHAAFPIKQKAQGADAIHYERAVIPLGCMTADDIVSCCSFFFRLLPNNASTLFEAASG